MPNAESSIPLSSLKEGGGGRDLFYELLMALYFFVRKNNVSLFKKKLIGGSYEKIIPFYFLYEILKEAIFFKKIL